MVPQQVFMVPQQVFITTTSFLLTWLKEKKQGNKIILFIPGKQYKKVNKEIDRVNRTH